MIEALRRLVEREGGPVAVADAIDANDHSLYQILKGVRLPSGRPKGVGPGLRAKLDARFPGWLTAPPPQQVPPTLAQALPVVLEGLAGLPPTRWASVRAQLDLLAAHPEMRDDVMLELRHLLGPVPDKRQVNAR